MTEAHLVSRQADVAFASASAFASAAELVMVLLAVVESEDFLSLYACCFCGCCLDE